MVPSVADTAMVVGSFTLVRLGSVEGRMLFGLFAFDGGIYEQRSLWWKAQSRIEWMKPNLVLRLL